MGEPLSNDVVQHALGKFFTDPVVSKTRFFKMGAENTTGLIEGNFGSVVLRVWGERHSRMGSRKLSDIHGELAFMDACRSAQVPVPRVYVSLAGHEFEELVDGRKFGVMDYVEGEEPAHFTRPMVETLATAVAKMDVLGQTFKFPMPRSWQGTVVDLAQERLKEVRSRGIQDGFVEQLAKKLELGSTKIDLASLPFGPIHGDVMYQNIKYVGERLSGIFDFDDCRESYLIEDITKTLLFAIEDPVYCVLGDDMANAKIFMEAYEQVRPLSELEKAALPVLSTARFIYELLKFYLHGASHPQAAEILEAKEAAYEKFRPLFEG
ncbi:MAG TPA: phosphotransferase [Candidatus Saccharimonadia bacterium]|nr:phosphotransferase [Candidatus Saccharimonadia bacterium]